jgi:hypothetical protein
MGNDNIRVTGGSHCHRWAHCWLLCLTLHERAAPKMLLVGLPNGKWNDLNLSRKAVRGREVTVALNQHAPDNQHRIAWRKNLRHSPRHGSLPAGAHNDVVAGFGPVVRLPT